MHTRKWSGSSPYTLHPSTFNVTVSIWKKSHWSRKIVWGGGGVLWDWGVTSKLRENKIFTKYINQSCHHYPPGQLQRRQWFNTKHCNLNQHGPYATSDTEECKQLCASIITVQSEYFTKIILKINRPINNFSVFILVNDVHVHRPIITVGNKIILLIQRQLIHSSNM
jgi:hypothetical protein